MYYIRDMLFVRSLERKLGRSLTEQELLEDEVRGEFYLELPNGRSEWITIERLSFPYDLLDRPSDSDISAELLAALEKTLENAS
jgi:hypothetical protein